MKQSLSSLAALVLLVMVAVLSLTRPLRPALTTSTSGQPNHWDFSAFAVQYSINPQVGTNLLQGSAAAVSAINASFSTWNNAPNASISIAHGGDTGITTAGFDGVNLVCFVCQGDFSKDASTLAVTITTTADRAGEDTRHGTTSAFAGQIMDADILFNPSVTWTTNGAPGQQDLQTVATHEIGHFLGLDHSGVVRAIMFPFAPPVETTLSYDDVAAIAALYPKQSPDFPTGTITGTIRFASGGGVFGAHVFADSTTNSAPPVPNVRKSTVSAVTHADGIYTITGLPPDSYDVGVEPLDGPATNSDISGYAAQFGNGQKTVQTNFNTRFH